MGWSTVPSDLFDSPPSHSYPLKMTINSFQRYEHVRASVSVSESQACLYGFVFCFLLVFFFFFSVLEFCSNEVSSLFIFDEKAMFPERCVVVMWTDFKYKYINIYYTSIFFFFSIDTT